LRRHHFPQPSAKITRLQAWSSATPEEIVCCR